MSFNGGVAVGELLERRRAETAKRIGELRQRLGEARGLCGDRACVYITGSFSRGEATIHSDLDLFIAGKGTRREPALGRLTEILIKAELIEAVRTLHIPDFSGDGEYLVHYTVGELVDTKCFLGVMRPATGKVHRGCAVRCLSGGAPPALLVRDEQGNGVALLLASLNDQPLDIEWELAARVLEVEGDLELHAGTPVLRVQSWRLMQ